MLRVRIISTLTIFKNFLIFGKNNLMTENSFRFKKLFDEDLTEWS